MKKTNFFLFTIEIIKGIGGLQDYNNNDFIYIIN